MYLPGKSSDVVHNPVSSREVISSDSETDLSNMMKLESSVALTLAKENSGPTPSTNSITPRKPYCELGPKQREKRAKFTSSHYSSEELLEATYLKYIESGDEAISAALKFLMNPDNAKKNILRQ